MGVIAIAKPLRDRLGDEATESLTEIIRELDLEARKDALALAEERFERRLTEEIAKVNERLTLEIGKVNERLTLEIGKVNGRITEESGRLMVEIQRVRADLIKWMFIFWLGQIGVLSGIIFVMMKWLV